MDYMSKEKLEEMKKIEDFRSRVLKYIVYKKRTESEIRKKFENEDQDLLDDTIAYFKEQKYINDEDYIRRAVNEFIALKNMSIKEVKYKLIQKGINSNLLDDYICKNKEAMLEYEISSCKNIVLKKSSKMEIENIKNYLYSKGYMSESISIAMDELEEN
ncbi:MAG: RecX family transcriptional regulator [Clostridia bacterium]|nr:RecX family transcriptional regulator [Clostridia bacterium]